MAMSKEVDLAHAQMPVPCDTCEDDEVPGTYYCIQCKKTLCEDCEKSHKKFTKDHKVILRTQMDEIDASILTCSDHKCEASFHCEKCNVPVCLECVTGKHQGHKMENIKHFMKRRTEMLQGDINEMKKVVLPKLEKQENGIKSERANYNRKIQEIVKEMERENKIFQNELDRVYLKRIQSLYSTQKKHLEKFDERTAEINSQKELCKRKVSEYQDAIGRNSLPAIIDIAERKDPKIHVPSIQKLPEPPCFVPTNLQMFVQKLGRLQISSSLVTLQETKPTIVSKFKSPLKGKPRMFVTKEGNVWLGGHESKKLVMVNIKGEVLMKRNIQLAPYALAEMDNGDLIVSPNEGSIVTSFQVKGGKQHIFDLSPNISLGVSITTANGILICTSDGKVVRSNSDGTKVEEIYKGSCNGSTHHAVEAVDGNIFFSDITNSAVMMISKDGKVLSKITKTSAGQKMQWPNCLTVDKMGNILCTDLEKHCVYLMDQNQQVKELLGTSHNIKNPTWLIVDHECNLWLTQKDGSVIVVKYLA